jgi:radical SAM superfamily enzyme YgiQ (UPF0313 family)
VGAAFQGVLRATDVSKVAGGSFEQARRPLRVLLIQPPTTGCVRSLLPQLEEEGAGEGIGFKPPLGLLYVATTVKERSSHEVRVIDAQAEGLSFEDVRDRAVAFRPDVVGISAWTDWWYPSFRTGQLIKEALPETHLTYGGPHLGIYPEITLEVPFVDSVVVGDGELPFLYLCNMIANGGQSNDVPGLHFKELGVKGCGATFFVQGDLDEIPIPDRTLLDVKRYGSVLSKQGLVTTMITSRGCPHKCTFCKLNFQKTLQRTAANTLEEFRRIARLGIREVEVYDDTFTWSPRRVREVCEGLIAESIDVEWAVRDRVANARADLLDDMYRAGCRRVHYGIESGSDRVLDLMKKNITTRQARRAVELAKDAGMTVLTYFMFGNLGETLDDMRRTIDFALELDADYCEFSITIPYAGTEMYEQGLANGLISRDYWADYARRPIPSFLPPEVIEEGADLPTLVKIRNDAVRRFYFRPRYMWREARRVQSLGELWRKMHMGGRLAQSVYSK